MSRDSHPTAVAVRTLADLPLEIVSEALSRNVRGNGREDAWSSDAMSQQSGNREVKVTNDLGLHPFAVLAMEEPVLGVPASQFGAMPGRLLVSAGGDDLPDQFLATPSLIHEPGSEPVEELGV